VVAFAQSEIGLSDWEPGLDWKEAVQAPDRRCPRYRRMETKGDGRSGAQVKLTPSPRALLLRRTNVQMARKSSARRHLPMSVGSGAADTNAVRASSQNAFCARPIARDQSQHQKTTQFWLLFGPWFHTIEPQFIRMLGIIWGKEKGD
jgi:hypothetical protein